MKSTSKFLLAIAFSLYMATTLGQQTAGLPGSPPESRMIKIQVKVEDLFERRDYIRAHFIYRHELAVVGDKYAQYMVGFMHLTGKGVQKDAVMASAWYRLAAERRAPEFIAVRDRLMAALDAVDIGRSDQAYVGLCLQYSDLVLMLKLIREDLKLLNESTTGSRLPGHSRAVNFFNPRHGNAMTSEQYFRQIRKRLQSRLDFITGRVEIDRIEGNVGADELNALQLQVAQYLATVGDR